MRCYAVTEFGKPLSRIELPDPEPRGTEVLVRMTRCGVCHSDVHFRHGYFDLGSRGQLKMGERGISLPLVPGHEVLGEVEAVGPEAGEVPIGATRLVYPWVGCGSCHRCKAGDDNLCAKQQSIGVFRPGGYAEHVLVPHPRYLVDIGRIDPSVAATYACSGLTAYSAARKVVPVAGDAWCVVIGAGGLGLNAIHILRAMDVKRILAVDIDQRHLKAAQEAGADAVIDSSEPEPVRRIQEATGNRGEAILDFVASAATAQLAFDAVPKGGTYVLVGLHGGSLDVPLPGVVLRALSLLGSLQGSLRELQGLVRLANEKGIDPLPITNLPLDQAPAALQRLEDGEVIGRLVLQN
jgi:alcohol dehydrogenase, propanol-preferring